MNMQDVTGNELKIGDKVVFIHPSRPALVAGTVKELATNYTCVTYSGLFGETQINVMPPYNVSKVMGQ